MIVVTVTEQPRVTVDVTIHGNLTLSGAQQAMTEGEKVTGTDAGILGQQSLTNDYLYTCVTAGVAGVAIWKKSILFQSI